MMLENSLDSQITLGSSSTSEDQASKISRTNGLERRQAIPSVHWHIEEVSIEGLATASESIFEYANELRASWIFLQHRYGGNAVTEKNHWGLILQPPDELREDLTEEIYFLPAFSAGFENCTKISELLASLRPFEVPKKLYTDNLANDKVGIFFQSVQTRPEDGLNDATRWDYRIQANALETYFRFKVRWDPHKIFQQDASAKLHSFVASFKSIMSDRMQPISALLQPNEAELDQIWKWNADVPSQINQPMHEFVCACAKQTPTAPAVHAWDGSFSFAQLWCHVVRVACQLSKLGIGEGSVVPLCFQKSKWTAVAVLGVMRAGAAFTLMTPSQPIARLRSIVDQTSARIAIASNTTRAVAKQLCETVLIVSDSYTVGEGENSDEYSLPKSINASAPMYIQFTSGSTGQPKGVVISYANYSSGALPRASKVGYDSETRCLDFPSYAFDVSIDCIICTLSFGGCICVLSEEDRMNNLNGSIRALNANMVHVTPSVARMLDSDVLQSIKVLGLGGEFVPPGDVQVWNKLCKVVIAYGPSECTVGCTINDEANMACTGIGKGAGCVTWIVDLENHQQLAPVGSVGELLIEGPIVGSGYLGQPEKTAEVFIEDPQWLCAGHDVFPGRRGRLYKTGDLVKYDSRGSGTIDFVGRKDQQVKLRGQRLELGEVEFLLRKQLPSEYNVVVDLAKLEGREPALVACLSKTSDVDSPIDCNVTVISLELQSIVKIAEEKLSELLPQFMIPTVWIPLSKIPMLASCKVDRKTIRGLLHSGIPHQLGRTYQNYLVNDPHLGSGEESSLFKCWQRVLGNDIDLSRHNNFFQLGGDSLKAMKLVGIVRDEGFTLTVANIFARPSLSEMASTLKRKTEFDEGIHEPCFSLLQPNSVDHIRSEAAKFCELPYRSVEDVYPCTPLQEGMMALSAKISDAYVARRVVDLPDLESGKKLYNAFEKAAKDSNILRTRIVQVPGAGLFQVVTGEQISCQFRNSLEGYLASDQQNPMMLGSPLVRFAIIHCKGVSGAKFVLTIHHALYDGWCMPLIVERVNAAYHGGTTARHPNFKGFIKYLCQTNHEASNAFWSEYLDGANEAQFPHLPSKQYQPRADSLLEHTVTLPERVALSTTVATAIRAAWAIVASRHNESDDIIFGETLTGRNAPIPAADTVEGPMITTVPVRIKIRESSTTSEFLREIQDSATQRIPYEHAGLQNIRRLSSDAREACNLRAGLVMHPRTDGSVVPGGFTGPADAFLPASDADAALEALKFNTYPLMLVFTMNEKGFLIMASFDSNCISTLLMAKVLKELDSVIQQLSNGMTRQLSNLSFPPHTLDDDSTAPQPTVEFPPCFESSCASVSYETQAAEHLQQRWTSKPGNAVLNCRALDPLKDPSVPSPNCRLLNECPGNSAQSSKVTIQSNGNVTSKQILRTQLPETLEKQGKLARIWSSILSCELIELSGDSDFFDCGGDSIAAMKLVSEARQQGLELTVAQVFRHRELESIAAVTALTRNNEMKLRTFAQFSTLNMRNAADFVEKSIRGCLAERSWKIEDVYPARPMQDIAVAGTTKLPRYSVRYEVLYFGSAVDRQRLEASCQILIHNNEILRTVFVRVGCQCYAVVLSGLAGKFTSHRIEGDLKSYTNSLCSLDVQTLQPLGSPFISFYYVEGQRSQSCLIIKISHSLYDEISFPNLLNQLSSIFNDRPHTIPRPFSEYVKHVVHENIPESIKYWQNLLRGSSMSILRPDTPLGSRKPASFVGDFDISKRPRGITIATLPTAAWALCLAKRLSTPDVVFGEVVSGRNTGFPNCDLVLGPCWQYIPVRVQFEEGMTMLDLLSLVQTQHISSSRFEGMGFVEIARQSTDWPETVVWFDSVVHQDVEHVGYLEFRSSSCRTETLYPHLEPLREIKIQSFVKGNVMRIEIVTFECWSDFGRGLLADMGKIVDDFVQNPSSIISI